MIGEEATPALSRELLRAYVLPQVLLFAAAAVHAAPLAVVALAVIPLVVPRRWLLLNWFGISLINFTLYISGASWISLLSTYYFGAVVAARLGVLNKPSKVIVRESRFELVGLALIAVSFVFFSRGHYFIATAIKSSLQLGFLLALSILLRQLEPGTFADLRRQLLALLPIHLILYLLASVALWRVTSGDDRFGGMLGAQVCAFSLTLVFALFWFAKDKTFAYVALLGVALTGSRTYVGIAAVVVFAPLFAARARLGTKIAAGVGLVVLLLVGWELLPYLSERFIVNEDFYGSFLGRFLNYQNAVEHIHGHPVFGEGMGSMLQVLEDWIPEYFEFSFGLSDEGRDRRSVPDPVRLDGRFLLRGSVDLIERRRDGGSLRVTDHKTGKNRAKEGLIVGGGGTLQPVLYSAAIEQGLGRKVVEGRLYYCTTAGGFTHHPIAMDDYNRSQGLQVLTIIDRSIEEGFLVAAPAERACTWCDFRPVCGPGEEERVSRKAADKIADLEALRAMR